MYNWPKHTTGTYEMILNEFTPFPAIHFLKRILLMDKFPLAPHTYNAHLSKNIHLPHQNRPQAESQSQYMTDAVKIKSLFIDFMRLHKNTQFVLVF